MSIAIDSLGEELRQVTDSFLDKHKALAVARTALESQEDSLPAFFGDMSNLGWLSRRGNDLRADQPPSRWRPSKTPDRTNSRPRQHECHGKPGSGGLTSPPADCRPRGCRSSTFERLIPRGSDSEFSAECAAVTDTPETQYTRSADGTNLAYQVSGEGPLELVFLLGPSPIDLLAEDPEFVGLRRRLGSFSRTVWFDHRGMGASEGDGLDALPGEISDADLTAVLDAVGFQRPAQVSLSGGRAIHFSVTYPE
jgi:hypothetical protein